MLRTITLPQVGVIAVGHHFRCERLASGHVLVTGSQLAQCLLVDPTFATAAPIGRGIAAVHAGADVAALAVGSDLHLRRASKLRRLRTGGVAAERACRFTANGVWLWELARRRRWVVRVRRVDDGRVVDEAALPDPDPTVGAWAVAAEHPLINAVVARSVDRHVAIELGADGRLDVRPLPLDVFIDWLPDGRAFVAARFDGRVTIHRWPGDHIEHTVPTTRLGELMIDQLGLHGRVIDADRALLDTLAGRLLIVDLRDASAEIVEVRLTGDTRSIGLSWLELGRDGRVLTGRAGDDLLRVWDGTAVLRTVPARGPGLR